jgi:hypothetical protein
MSAATWLVELRIAMTEGASGLQKAILELVAEEAQTAAVQTLLTQKS